MSSAARRRGGILTATAAPVVAAPKLNLKELPKKATQYALASRDKLVILFNEQTGSKWRKARS